MVKKRFKILLSEYLIRDFMLLEYEKVFFQEKTNLKVAIITATLATNCEGKKHSHQKRIPNSALQNFKKKVLSKESKIQRVQTFQDLYMIVQSCKVFGVGNLTIYDVSLRIGFYLSIYPIRLYLQAGSKIGYQRLIESGIIKVGEIENYLKSQNILSYHFENFLCLYRDKFISQSIEFSRNKRC